MDKSRMTFRFRPTRQEPVQEARFVRESGKEARPFWESVALPHHKERFARPSFHRKQRPYARTEPKSRSPFGGGTWLWSALLAAVTGIALGLAVLFVFQNGASDLHPTVTTMDPKTAPRAQDSPVTLPGVQLTAYQVGVYKELERAKKGVAEFEKMSISPVLRSSDGYQLLVGVAPDKTRGQSIADALTQAQIHFYAKEYKIIERKGKLQGIAGKDAATLASVLTQAVQLMKNGIEIAIDPARQEKVGDWRQNVQTFAGQAEMARKILEKAGKKGELIRLDDMTEQLRNAASSIASGKELLMTERQLVQGMVDYEELINKLIP
jgi:hypothetical protein